MQHRAVACPPLTEGVLVRVVFAPDSMGGILTAREVAVALAAGWQQVRGDDDLAVVPLSDGGEGLLDVLHGSHDTAVEVEVAGPLGLPVQAWLSLRPDGTAVVESAQACGLHLVPPDRRDPVRATTYGVGELIEAARDVGARRILVGLGGSATVDGGAGALTGLGMRLRVADGSGLKVGAADLHRIDRVEPGWRDAGWDQVEVVLLSDVRTPLSEAAATFGPQKGATDDAVEQLAAALDRWARVAERDLAAPGLAAAPGTGAAGGLAFGLAAALGASIGDGAATVADLVGLDDHLRGADLVITGEGRVDATSMAGKVVGHVRDRARDAGIPIHVVAGVEGAGIPDDLPVELAPASDATEATAAVEAAAGRLAAQVGG